MFSYVLTFLYSYLLPCYTCEMIYLLPLCNLLCNTTFCVVRGMCVNAIEMYGEISSKVCSTVIMMFEIFLDVQWHDSNDT